MSRFIMVVVNTVFIILAIAVMAMGGYIMEKHFSAFTTKGAPFAIIIGGAALLVVSIFGCCGAMKDKRRFLCPYATIVFALLVVEAIGAGLIFDHNALLQQAEKADFNPAALDDAQKVILKTIQDSCDELYDECDASGSVVDGGELKCTEKDYQWFADFYNKDCTTTTPKELQVCFNQTSSDPAKVTGAEVVYCKCRTTIVTDYNKYNQKLAYLGIIIAGSQALLVIFSIFLMCTKPKPPKEMEAPLYVEQRDGQPVQGGQVYVHHAA